MLGKPVTFQPTRPPMRAAVAVALLATCAGACASGQKVEVKKVDAVARPPANVSLYLKITQEDGQPVTLLANDFKVYEDGKALPSKKTKRALLPVKYAVDRFVLVVVDLSGPLVDSEYLSTMQDALAKLAARIGKDARMGLSAFDGDGMVPFINFDDADPEPGLVAMRKFRPRSRNSDLWGTFLASLDSLDQALAHASAPHQQSTLVLITDRRDKAARHSQGEALARVEKSPSEVYVIGIGDGINKEELEPLGKTGALFADEARQLSKPMKDLTDRIEGHLRQDYLFSYCSPQKVGKKSGKHTVEVRIATTEWHGAVEHEFSTNGFTKATCDPQAIPDFNAQATEGEAEPAASSDDDADTNAAGKGRKAKGGGKKKPKPAEEEDSGADPADKS